MCQRIVRCPSGYRLIPSGWALVVVVVARRVGVGWGVTSAASEMLKEQGGKMVPLEDPAGAGAEAEPFAHVVGLLCCRALGEWGG